MFTRDIGLEDCILDLIDNSMDALLGTRNINIESEILAESEGRAPKKSEKARIHVEYSEKRLSITDNCGGIKYLKTPPSMKCFVLVIIQTRAEEADDSGSTELGSRGPFLRSGIMSGLRSNTGVEAFRVEFDVKQWAQRDTDLKDWTFPIVKLDGAALRKTYAKA